MEPKINLVAYKDLGNGKKIFVMVPDEINRWMKTELCVVCHECSQCGALIGEPCYDWKHFNSYKIKKYSAAVHYKRRKGK